MPWIRWFCKNSFGDIKWISTGSVVYIIVKVCCQGEIKSKEYYDILCSNHQRECLLAKKTRQLASTYASRLLKGKTWRRAK